MDEIVTMFYYCSLTKDFSNFDFGDAFDEFRDGLQRKLNEHGLGSFEDYQDQFEDIYGDAEHLIPDELTIQTDYIWFTAADAAQAVLKAQYEALRDTFTCTFEHLQEMIDKMDDTTLALQQKIELFDSIIHAQHETGDIFEDLDTEYLKGEAEEMLAEVA